MLKKYKETFAKDPVISDDIVEKIHEGVELSEIETLISEDHAEPLYFEHQLVGCVKPAHDIDVNLSSHVMHENLMSKASSVLALLYAVKNAGIEKSDVEYVIDCAEEACGDMNQRGGGNFAKAAAEVAGLVNATGSDARGFCGAEPVPTLWRPSIPRSISGFTPSFSDTTTANPPRQSSRIGRPFFT